MTVHLSQNYTSSGFFIVRTPLMPFAEWAGWLERVRALAVANGTPLEAGSEAELSMLQQDLHRWSMDPTVSEALFLASSSLWEKLHSASPEDLRTQVRLNRALGSYRARMAGRCTPFGLFAGWSTGSIGKDTCLQLPGRSSYSRHTRLDCGFLLSVVDTICSSADYQRELRLRSNPTLIPVGGRLRYLQARTSNGLRRYYLMSATADEPLSRLIDLAGGGARRGDLRQVLIQDADESEIDAYLDQVIAAQILVPELDLSVTGTGPLDDLIRDIAGERSFVRECDALRTAKSELAQIDSSGLGQAKARYDVLIEGLTVLSQPPPADRLFQVDLVKPAEKLSIDGRVAEQLLDGVVGLHALFAQRTNDLGTFCERFMERYGGASIPLLEATDEESGVGFGSGKPGRDAPLLQGVALPTGGRNLSFPLDATSLLIQRKLYETLAAGRTEMVLEQESVDACRSSDTLPLPDAFQVTASLLPPDQQMNSQFRIYHVVGPSGARFFGRFCYADAELMAGVQGHLTAEEGLDDALFCELVHLPQGRLGNVIVRPVLRAHEVPILAKSGAPAERQIQLSEIVVSVSNGRVILHVPRIGRRIIPRLTSAHNPRMPGLGVYRFLAAVQNQDVSPLLAWDWRHLKHLPTLPRVRYGCHVLAVRTWRLDQRECELLSGGIPTSRFGRVQELRVSRNMDRYVGLVEDDQVLPVDLDNIASVEGLLATIRGRRTIALSELCPGPSELEVQGPEGGFANEIVVPFVRCVSKVERPTEYGGLRLETASGAPNTKWDKGAVRRYSPGSEWMYLKLYCGESSSDRLLLTYVEPMVRRATGTGLVSEWFFIRYSDGNPHVRVRLRAPGKRFSARAASIVHRMAERALDDGLIWRAAVDTYEREIERYGGDAGIGLCEAMFHSDSEAVLGLIRDVGPLTDERWLRTVAGIHSLLDDFGLSTTERCQLMATQAAVLWRQLDLQEWTLHSVKERYRAIRDRLMPILTAAESLDPLIQRRSVNIALIAALRERELTGRLSVGIRQIVPSLVHMHVNRMLVDPRVLQEAILYQYMSIAYGSVRARAQREESATTGVLVSG